MIINLLSFLYKNEITEDQAYDILEAFVSYMHMGILKEKHAFDVLGFSKREGTAYCHSASLSSISKWRYEGWPKKCYICGKEFTSDSGIWYAYYENNEDEISHVVHGDCMPEKE